MKTAKTKPYFFGGSNPPPYEGIACASRCLPLCVILSGAIAELNRKARHRRGILQSIPYGYWVAEPHSSAEIPPRTLGAFALHAQVRLRSGCEQAKTPRGDVFVKRYPKDRKRKERATPRHSATISAGRKRRGVPRRGHSATISVGSVARRARSRWA